MDMRQARACWLTLVLAAILCSMGCSEDSVLRSAFGGTGGVYRSENAGERWERAGLESQTVHLLAADTQQPPTLYAVTQRHLNISTDGGSTWDARLPAIPDDNLLAMAVDPEQPGSLFLGQQKGLSKSEDGGRSWRRIRLPKNPEEGVSFLSISPGQPGTVFAVSTYLGLYTSEDRGEHWREQGSFPPDYPFTWAVDPQQPRTLYAGTQSGAFRSDDGGRTWQAINKGLTASTLTLHINELAIDPQQSHILYAGTRKGILKTLDRGESWSQTGQTSGSFTLLTIDPVDSQTLFASGRLIKSTDGGISWEQLPHPGASFPILTLAFHPKKPGVLYVGTADPADL